MLNIDGSMGEGGGQILRSSLALSLATGTPFRMDNIRAGRRKPGLLRQHLTAVRAAGAVGSAQATGAELGSTSLTFVPAEVRGGEFRFAVGTAGSATLVLQAVLPALVTAPATSTLTLEGGTHNPFAPPFDFLERAFLPLVGRMGPAMCAVLERPGFYPAGGGRFRVEIQPVEKLEPIEVLERGKLRGKRARAYVANLSPAIGSREIRRVRQKMSWGRDYLEVVTVDSAGPGNVVVIDVRSDAVTEVFTGFGERGVGAFVVADQAIDAARRYLKSDVPVGQYLADQLLVPMALAGGGAFRTLALTSHTRTNIEVIKTFLDVDIDVREEENGVRVTLGGGECNHEDS